MSDAQTTQVTDARCQMGNPLVHFTTAPADYDYKSSNRMLIENFATLQGKPVRMLIACDEARMRYQQGRFQSGNHAAFTADDIAVYGDMLVPTPQEDQIWHFRKVIDLDRDAIHGVIKEFLDKRDELCEIDGVTVESVDGGYGQVVTVIGSPEAAVTFDEVCQVIEAYA